MQPNNQPEQNSRPVSDMDFKPATQATAAPQQSVSVETQAAAPAPTNTPPASSFNPQAASPSSTSAVAQPKSSKKLLFIVLALVLLLGAVGAFFLLNKKSDDKKPVATTLGVNQTRSYALTDDIEYTAAPKWAFPASVAGWEMKVFDQGGVNQLAKSDASESYFTSYQMASTDTSGYTNDKTASNKFADDFLTGLKKEASKASELDASTAVLDASASGKKIEFVQRDMTYTSKNVDYKTRVLVRSTAKYVLVIQYQGKAANWTEADWAALMKNVKVVGDIK